MKRKSHISLFMPKRLDFIKTSKDQRLKSYQFIQTVLNKLK